MDEKPTHSIVMRTPDGERLFLSVTARNSDDAAIKARVWLAEQGKTADIKMVLNLAINTGENASIAFNAEQIESDESEAQDERA